MSELLHTSLAFIVAIALLVAVHEFGHFIVARKLGIKVEKFSIGFGPALFSWRSRDGEVLYVIAAIPMGGFVKMLGENPDEQGDQARTELSAEDQARAFDAQPVWKRASVAIAGPGFNFAFAVLAYMLVGWLGQAVLPAIAGQVDSASIARAAGLQAGDRIVAVGQNDVHSWQQMEELLKERAGQPARLKLLRQQLALSIDLNIPQPEKDPLLVNMTELLGFDPGLTVRVEAVVKSSPADRAGLQAGDVIEKINGEPVASVHRLISLIQAHAGRHIIVEVKRGDALLQLDAVPETARNEKARIGIRLSSQAAHGTELYRMGLWDGMRFGFVRTWEMTAMTLKVFGKMVTTVISPDNLGGPIAIAQMAGKAAELGLVYFISFLALISVNLGVLNLFPVPVLDGGHLLYLGLEKIRGKPLSPKILEYAQMAGLALIITLMAFAFYNDLIR